MKRMEEADEMGGLPPGEEGKVTSRKLPGISGGKIGAHGDDADLGFLELNGNIASFSGIARSVEPVLH